MPAAAAAAKKDKTVSDPGDKWGQALQVHEEHGLILLLGLDALSLPPAIEEAVGKVLNTGSWEKMRTDSAHKIIDSFAKSGSSNELSILIDFWLGLRKHTSVKIEGDQSIQTEWRDQGLRTKFDQQFYPRGPSMLKLSDPHDKMILDAIPTIQHPKPDITMGLAETVGKRIIFNKDEVSANRILGQTTQVTGDVFHPFAVWEQKGSKCIELAQVQALRGGSTLVWAFRENEAQAKMIDLQRPGIDAKNIAFSFAGNTSLTRLFVHWADVGEDKITRYFMQEIREYSISKIDPLKRLRSDLEHILDWGTLTRLNSEDGIKVMLSRIMGSNKAQTTGPNKAQKTEHGASAGQSTRSDQGWVDVPSGN
ncbi:MAG: hypothetical protein Q9223_005393 [Gallowayella weberi]